MKLKSLVLSGFKSFPKRTVIHFSQGVSAIVGPNGSGKSNIVDAIRWVLGEQNPRLLRAERMDELIYSGNSKGTVDAARVKLSLVECQDMAPPELKDFPEIDIERVLFRDGTSKFLLNGKNCRLKEIRYLFLDTGTGARAYSIIDQGRVGQFVTMTPEERRLIVEEAAGIARYRERRIQALTRMKNTLENLERLEDVIAEVKRQRNGLKRQAKKAEKFSKLREEEDRLGLTILKIRFIHLEREEKALIAQIERENEKLAAFKADMAGVELQMSKLDMELEQRFSVQKELREKASDIKSKRDAAFKELSATEKDLAILEQKQDALIKEQERLSRRIHGLEQAISKYRKDLDQDYKQRASFTEKSDALKEEINRQAKILARLRTEREKIKDQFVVVASKRAQVSEKLSSAKSRRLHLEDRLEMMDEKRAGLVAEMESMKEHIKEQEVSLKSLVEQLSLQEENLQNKKGRLFSLKQLVDEIRKKKNELGSSLSGLEARLGALSRIDEEGTGLLKGIKALRRQMGKETLMVADMIEVADGFEDLVETALGQTLQSLVFDSKEDVLGVIKRISKEAKKFQGASVLLSALSEEQKTEEKQQTIGEGFEILGQKVLGDNTVSNKVRQLLSNWIVVEEMSQFLKSDLSQVVFSEELFVISRDGFIFTPWQELRYKASNQWNNSGIIARKKEIKKLKEKRAFLLKEIEKISIELKETEQNVQRLEEEVRSEVQRFERLRQKKNTLEKEVDKSKAQLNRLEDRLELLEFEWDEIKQELDDIVPALSDFERELREASDQETNLKVKLEKIEAELSTQEKRLKEVNDKRSKYLLKVQEISGRIKANENELKRMTKALERSEQEKEANKTKLKELSFEKKALSETLEKRKADLESLSSALMGVEKELKNIEQEIDVLREKRLVFEKEKSEIQKQISKVNGEVNKLQIMLSDTTKNKEHIKEVCSTQFRTNIDDILQDDSFHADSDVSILERQLKDVAKSIESFGPVNLMAMDEFKQLDQRLTYLLEQKEDVQKSLDDIQNAIQKIDKECKEKFKDALSKINKSLENVFSILFDGGKAQLTVMDEKKILETGVEYKIKLPGKRISSLSLLSGGEKALAALALIFAIFLVKPTPFCLLDEVDAPLDEANTLKFNGLVRKISASTQVILVTHNQQVMEMADSLYGVTMEEKGISKIVTVKMV